MSTTTITGDGYTALLGGSKTPNDKITIRSPAVMTATVTLAYVDENLTVNDYVDGLIASGSQVLANVGRGVVVGVNVTGYTADFSLEVGT